MNSSLQNKLSEVVGANNVSYIINENGSFSVTGYKVMKNHTGSGLLKCAKLTYNGKIKLVYIVGNLKPLSYVVTRLGVNELNAIIFNLIQRALEIKSNGFFRAENIELNFDKIFVDTTDNSVYLIYFPVSGGSTGKQTGFENEFRIALINLFNSFPVFTAPQFQRLCSDLANGSLSLNQILKKMQDNLNGNNYNQSIYDSNSIQSDYAQIGSRVTPDYRQGVSPDLRGYQMDSVYSQSNQHRNNYQANDGISSVDQMSQPVMTISAINSPVQISLTINMPEYLIGKNPDLVNGAVTHNPAISRVHCKITFSGGKYYLTDMGSANGTYLNCQKLEKHQTAELSNGDYLKLANSDFVISF